MSVYSSEPFVADEKEDLAAALLLREAEKLLKEGQPRQAIAHIVEVTGVEQPLAEEFIAELKARLFS